MCGTKNPRKALLVCDASQPRPVRQDAPGRVSGFWEEGRRRDPKPKASFGFTQIPVSFASDFRRPVISGRSED